MALRDPFLAKKRLDPDEVIKSSPVRVDKTRSGEAFRSAALSRKSAAIKQAPVGPRVIEVDGDQDSVAREYDLLRPGQTTDAPEIGGELCRPVGKSAGPQIAVEKVWSDEARAAALEARRHGYTSSEEPKEEPGRGMTQGFVHPETLHGVDINSYGDWSHSDANGDTKGRGGTGAQSLGRRLARVHGKPKSPTPGSGYSAFNSRGEKVGVTVPGAPTVVPDDTDLRTRGYPRGRAGDLRDSDRIRPI